MGQPLLFVVDDVNEVNLHGQTLELQQMDGAQAKVTCPSFVDRIKEMTLKLLRQPC